jgi:hypothetical protein
MSSKAKIVVYFLVLVALVGLGTALYIYNLNECMTEFSALYCITQVKF